MDKKTFSSRTRWNRLLGNKAVGCLGIGPVDCQRDKNGSSFDINRVVIIKMVFIIIAS